MRVRSVNTVAKDVTDQLDTLVKYRTSASVIAALSFSDSTKQKLLLTLNERYGYGPESILTNP